MNKRARYGLIAVGFVFFLIVSPLMVLYVRGVVYDAASGHFVSTGLFAVRTDPKNVSISIEGKKTKKGSGDIKFLRPKEYEVTITAPGYFAWSKRLRINSNAVTWIGNNSSKTYLLLKDGGTETLSGEMSDFVLTPSGIYGILGNSLVHFTFGKPAEQTRWPLPSAGSSLESSGDGTNLLIHTVDSQAYAFNTNAKKILPLGPLLTADSTFFISNNNIYALNKGAVYAINSVTGEANALAQNVLAFTATDNFFYYIQGKPGALALTAKAPSSPASSFLADVPDFKIGSIYISPERHVFLLLEDTLYRVNAKLDRVAGNVTSLEFNPQTGGLTFVHAGELERHDYATGGWTFISRSGGSLTNIQQRESIGYVFLRKNNSIEALELDTRDHPNEFTFYTSPALSKFIVDPEAKFLYVLDGKELKRIKIRE